MENSFAQIIKKLEHFFLYVTVALVPLVFFTATTESLELPKYIFFYAGTCAALVCFLAHLMILKQLPLRRTPLDLPLILLWLVMLVGSCLSLTQYESFFGDFTLLRQSFVTVSVGIVFYWLLVQYLTDSDRIYRLLKIFLASGAVAATYFVAKLFNIIPLPALELPLNVVSSSNSVWGLFLVLVAVLALTVIAIRGTSKMAITLAFVALIPSLAGIALIGFKIVWILLATALGLMLIFFLTYLDHIRSWWSSLAFSMLVASILFAVIGTPAWLTARTPTEINLGYSYSYQIARDSFVQGGWKERFFGSGPSTYIYNFSSFRPSALNTKPFWTSRFYFSASTAFDWFTENGLVSSIVWVATILVVLGVIIATWFKSIQDLKHPESQSVLKANGWLSTASDSPVIFWGVSSAWLTLVVGLVVLNIGASHWMLFWLFTAALVAGSFTLGTTSVVHKDVSLRTTPQYALVTSFSFILVFTGFIILGIYFGRFVEAEIKHSRSLGAPTDQRISLLNEAINLNGNRALFYVSLADAWLIKAGELSRDPKQSTEVYQALAAAIQAAKTATDIAPYNVAGWQLLSSVYTSAAAITPDAVNWIGQSLVRARELEPSNPVIYVGLATVKASNKQYVEAIGDLNQALNLKPNFLEAYLKLALLYEARGQMEQARQTLERGLPYGKTNSDYLIQLGRYYFNSRTGDDEVSAETLFQQAVYLNPNSSDGLFALAVLKERQGNRTEALQLYRRVLELNPTSKEIQAKINTLSGNGPVEKK